MSFWQELKRRNVVKVGAAYAVVAWIIAQVVSVVDEPLGLPEWFDTAVIVLLLIGFPLALLFAWAYELTPGGLKRTSDVPIEQSVTADTGQRLNYVLIGLAAGAIVTTAAFWFSGNDRDAEWARNDAIPRIERLVDERDIEAAYQLALEVERRVPGLPELAELWPAFSARFAFSSAPPGARLYRRNYDSGPDAWEAIGKTPIAEVRLPGGLSRLRFELEGYEPLERTLLGPLPLLIGDRQAGEVQDAGFNPYLMQPTPFRLDQVGTLPQGKVRVPGWSELVDGESIEFEDYFLGRYEVTNREYKAFIDAGGYATQSYWRHAILRDGMEIPWEEAMALFVDRTGRPGPSTWSGGDYPEGRDDYPVGGLSWYEAAAYAEFVGEELPTVYHWRHAINPWEFAWTLSASNMDNTEPQPVGAMPAMTWPGTYDMGGNVREWAFNRSGDRRYILGGGWNDQYYVGSVMDYSQPPLDRSPTNGFRLAITRDSARVIQRARASQPPPVYRDLSNVEPITDEVFEVYRSLHSYDSGPLDAVVEETIETRDWIRERVSFNAAYNGERMAVYLYLPRSGAAPFQTVVFAPGTNSWNAPTYDHTPFHLDFVAKNGRAVAVPVYKGSYERRDAIGLAMDQWQTNTGRDRAVQIHQDLRRTIDYLETRRDLDMDALAYYGLSMGGQFAPTNIALEPRFSVAVLTVGAVNPVFDFLPEIDPMNYLSRVTIPVLMLNSELDNIVPLEAAAVPFFEQLGTPPEHKRQVVQAGGHFVPQDVLIRETLDWLDRYLGPVDH